MDVYSGRLPRWFSDNEERAWGEKFFLCYIPIWVLVLVLGEIFFPISELNDYQVVLLGLAIGGPIVLLPALIAPRFGKSWYESYWFKANVFIFIVQFSGNYFISEYFFDVLGMIYYYPNISWNLDSALVGEGAQKVPLLMYFITQATYMTYHSSAIVLMRRVLTAAIPLKTVIFVILVGLLAYAWSWLETMSFANAALESSFRYEDKAQMLKYGSLVFGLMFVPSFPLFYYLMESKQTDWPLLKVMSAALSAALIGLLLTDLSTHFII